MKNIVSILAVVAATGAAAAPGDIIGTTTSATHPLWNGSIDVNAIPDHCEFVQNSIGNGSMNYDIESGKWTTTADATVTVNHRGASELTVTNTGMLNRTDAVADDMAVTVDYTGSGISGDGVISLADTTKISVGSLTESNGIKNTVINIGGTAQMTNTDVESNGIENGGQYIIVHTVNCIQ
ncbi:MAG: hypothetical protein GY727_14790 [Gammaproteobacteria bacterium]|nr:hypothetical protein [Gammaproteobacteria bacterium]